MYPRPAYAIRRIQGSPYETKADYTVITQDELSEAVRVRLQAAANTKFPEADVFRYSRVPITLAD